MTHNPSQVARVPNCVITVPGFRTNYRHTVSMYRHVTTPTLYTSREHGHAHRSHFATTSPRETLFPQPIDSIQRLRSQGNGASRNSSQKRKDNPFPLRTTLSLSYSRELSQSTNMPTHLGQMRLPRGPEGDTKAKA